MLNEITLGRLAVSNFEVCFTGGLHEVREIDVARAWSLLMASVILQFSHLDLRLKLTLKALKLVSH